MPPHQTATYARPMQKLTIIAELQNRIPIDFDHHKRSGMLTEAENSGKAAANVPAIANVPAAMNVPAAANVLIATPAIADPVVADQAADAAPITSKHKRGGVSTGAEVDGKGSYLHKWEYVLFSRTNIQNDPQQLDGSFVDREQANAKLDEITRRDNSEDGIAAVTRRLVYEYTPCKLLKVKRTLTNGEERVLWVERRCVDLQHDLTKSKRALKKWSANRPKLPLYIVECEFMTRMTAETPQQVPGESDESIPAMVHEQIGALSGEIELYRLPLAPFTERDLANEHAGTLFLEHSRVREEIRWPVDDYWWEEHAVAIHMEAEKVARMPGALYVAEMYTHDMNTRLGFDMIRVGVYAVDDVNGPMNN
ncbi:uncharacterized protein F4817DRAFT_345706 [Daldinia loculata]|uniref:uncharacterized protein n=1 Tax=Daldinia loculata TaxID=103429 RepID=UPI0020C42522|nr:uncharacterized protein F4817DRAFT_345706 [Daldinia loculata]KAI1644779.1 hypothetical protein F4817DRAFT_345706 [Daldinia loculata]